MTYTFWCDLLCFRAKSGEFNPCLNKFICDLAKFGGDEVVDTAFFIKECIAVVREELLLGQ